MKSLNDQITEFILVIILTGFGTILFAELIHQILISKYVNINLGEGFKIFLAIISLGISFLIVLINKTLVERKK